MARGSVDVRDKSRAYLCLQGNSIAHVFPSFDNSLHSHGIPTAHLFQTFVGVCDGEGSGTIYTLRSKRLPRMSL